MSESDCTVEIQAAITAATTSGQCVHMAVTGEVTLVDDS